MQTYKNLNNISQEVLDQIPKLENGKEVVFQMLNGHPNNDWDLAERNKNPMLYGKTQLSTFFRIKDPKNGVVNVGIPMGFDNDGNPKTYKAFLAGMYDGDSSGQFLGKFSLRGGRIDDEELFEVFWLSPEREGSPFADAKITPLFRIIDHQAENKKTLNKVDILRKALDVLKDMNDVHFIDFANSQNWDGDIQSVKAQVSDFAKNKPDVFLTIQNDPQTERKAVIKRALDKNIVNYDPASRKVTLGDTDLLTISKENTHDILSAINGWLNSAKNGKSVYDGILTQLKEVK